MKNIIILFIFSLTLFYKNAKAQLPPSDTAYQLVWSDDFTDSLDGSKWMQKWSWNMDDSVVKQCDTSLRTDVGYRRWYRSSTVEYPHDTVNCKVKSGVCSLITNKENFAGSCWWYPSCTNNTDPQCNGDHQCVSGECWHIGNKQFKYTTGMLLSKWQFQYGYFEIKFMLPSANANSESGPNFWLYQGGAADVPYCEVDIFEIRATDNKYTSNVHYRHTPHTSGDYSQYHSPGTVSANTWHTAGLLWTSNQLDYYLDDTLRYSMTNDTVRIDSLQPMQIVVDVNAPATNFCKYYDANSVFSYTYQIDYVKVWQLKHGCTKQTQTYCSNINPYQYGKIFKTVDAEGGSCADAITNTHYTDFLGTDYVSLQQGFSIDNNSTVLIDAEGCSTPPPSKFVQAVGPPPAGYIAHTQHDSNY